MCNAVKQPLSEEGGVEEVLSQLSLLYFWPSLLSRSTNPSSFKSWSEVAKWFIFGVFNQHRSVIEKRPFVWWCPSSLKALLEHPVMLAEGQKISLWSCSLAYHIIWPEPGHCQECQKYIQRWMDGKRITIGQKPTLYNKKLRWLLLSRAPFMFQLIK